MTGNTWHFSVFYDKTIQLLIEIIYLFFNYTRYALKTAGPVF